jgi:histidinol-phosphatase (PHP family)
MAEMCRAAIEKDIPEIGFCDHFDLIPEDPCFDFFHADTWWQDLEACRQEFSGSLQIKAGIEIGEPHRFPETVAELAANHDWDFMMGSLHWVGDTLIFDPDYYQRSKYAAYADYFRELHQLVLQNSINILAHVDIVKRYGFEHYGPYDPESHETELRSLLRSCAERDIAVEINTSTLRRSIMEPSPTYKILSWFREEGGNWVTLGSDAHEPDQVGFGLEKALKAVSMAGFESLASYERLVPRPVAITSWSEGY